MTPPIPKFEDALDQFIATYLGQQVRAAGGPSPRAIGVVQLICDSRQCMPDEVRAYGGTPGESAILCDMYHAKLDFEERRTVANLPATFNGHPVHHRWTDEIEPQDESS